MRETRVQFPWCAQGEEGGVCLGPIPKQVGVAEVRRQEERRGGGLLVTR